MIQPFEAFMAGFAASAEGFNGEYVGPAFDTPGLIEQALREEYDEWLDSCICMVEHRPCPVHRVDREPA